VNYNPYPAIPSEATRFSAYKAPQQYQHQHYQPLAFAATQPAPVSYAHPASNHFAYSSIGHGPQHFYGPQIPFNHYAYGPAQPMSPVLHAAPVASFAHSYQAPANTFYINPQPIHKVPIYNQQPQGYAGSYSANNYHQHAKPSHQASQIITSKPVALESPLAPTSASHIEHSHGAVSYTHVSQPNERKPSAAALIATPAPQQVYYHQQPQPIYSGGDYSKQIQYAAVPIASNYYPGHYGNVPYAHISRVPFAPPAAASTLIPSIAPAPQKVVFQ